MTQDFTYDDLNRLIQATGSAYGTQSFTYDAIGNMTNKAGRTMTYPTNGVRPHAVSQVNWSTGNGPSFCSGLDPGGAALGGGTSCILNYDANGNMTKRGNDILSYDSENRLKETHTFQGKDGSTTYTLQPGWNLISFPYLPDNKSISSILSSLVFGTDYDQISYYDPASSSWKHFVNDSDFNDLSSFEYGKSYEIYVTKTGGVSFTVAGKSPGADIAAQIKVGDNFIGPAVKSATPVSQVLGGLMLGTDFSDIKRFNASTQAFELYSQGTFSTFEPGKGYILTGLKNTSFSYGKTETVTTFVYDSAGSRVKKISGNSTSIYLGKDYDISVAAPVGGTTGSSGSLITKYIFLGERRISLKDSSGALLFFHEDHINSSNVVTDAAGNQAALYEYDPYGQTVTHTGSAEVKHRFTGQEADDSTGLYCYGARYYDPQLGRFVTADSYVQHPSDPQFLNRYTYARNNPVVFTDPTGNFAWFAFFAAFFAAVAKTAAVVAAVAETASIIASWGGHAHAAQTFGKIAGIAGIVSTSAGIAGSAAGQLSNAQASLELSAPRDPEMPRAPPGPGESSGLNLDKIVEIANKIKSAVKVADSVARILSKQIGPSIAYGETPSVSNQENYKFTIRAVRAGSGSLTGHAWIALTTPGGATTNYGFMPDTDESVLDPSEQYNGKVDTLDATRYRNYVEHTWNISKRQYEGLINLAIQYASKPFCGISNNCADFVVKAAKIAGVNIPRSGFKGPGVPVTNPNLIADWLDQLNNQGKK